MQLTEHFADTELGVAGCDAGLIVNAQFLCSQLLEPIRARFGEVRVHDAYRDAGHNERVGGKAESYHLFEDGRAAADIHAVGCTLQMLFDWIRLDSRLPFDKVILEKNSQGKPACVHLQTDLKNPPRREAYIGSTGAATDYVRVEVK